MEPKYVKIEINDLAYLLSRAYELKALEKSGVDNWEWYSESLSEYFDNKIDYYKYISEHYEEIK